MLSSETLFPLIETILSQISEQNNAESSTRTTTKDKKSPISSAEAITALGILTGVLKVDSLIMNRDQTVEIILLGYLRSKTKIEKMLDQMGDMSFEEVMRAFLINMHRVSS